MIRHTPERNEPPTGRNWRKLLLWSLGGVAAGTALALVRRPRAPSEALVLRPIPPDASKIELLTEGFELRETGKCAMARESYLLQSTPFLVWSLLDLHAPGSPESRRGARVYHVTYVRRLESGDEDEPVKDKFYGTVATAAERGKRSFKDCVARGGRLEIRKCQVGGAANGVETGEIHRSAAAILNYRFE